VDNGTTSPSHSSFSFLRRKKRSWESKERTGAVYDRTKIFGLLKKREKIAGSIPARPISMKRILEQAAKLCTPIRAERAKVAQIIKDVETKVNSALKKSKIAAKCSVGGSVAKGTWLPGVSDVDFFILFNYEKYKSEHQFLSDTTEKVLRNVFKGVQRLHGSRDYFNVDYKNFILEFVPVLEISELSDALNLTDYSPLHVYWVRDRVKVNRKLQTEIRLAKQFFKANGVYGAESYIAGFSGHATEILTIYYGSFSRLLKNVVEWGRGEVIDVNKNYKNSNQIFDEVNESKLQSPIIVIDPVEPARNAAAALGEEKFDLLKKATKRFLANPTIDFFKIKLFDVKLLKQKPGQKLFVLQTTPTKGKEDVVGCKLLKTFEEFQKAIAHNNFRIMHSGWHWPGKGSATFWIYLPAKPLPKERIVEGPPAKVPEQFIKQFRKKWKRIYLKSGRYWAKARVKLREPAVAVRTAAKQFKLKTLNL
jgi:tRNA nucleotidyltransferase (CCA-adding enzyme)